jgi:hypothetical protein
MGKAGWAITAAATVAIVVAWKLTGWHLNAAASIGNAASPVVGLFALVAVFVTARGVRLQANSFAEQQAAGVAQSKAVQQQLELQQKQAEAMQQQLALQHEALKLQREAQVQQQQELATQLRLQQDALKLQSEELAAHLKQQHQTALRDAYARFFEAVEVYRDAAMEYGRWASTSTSDKNGRRTQQAPVRAAREDMNRAKWAVELIDPDAERARDRWELTLWIPLEPEHDTHEHQRSMAKLQLPVLKKSSEAWDRLMKSLGTELGLYFGRKQPEDDASAEADQRAS